MHTSKKTLTGLVCLLIGLSPSIARAGSTLRWGYVGCSNTHDAMYGYQRTPGAAGHFWPWADYHIEGGTVHRWLTDPGYFAGFEHEVQVYDGGADPPVIFIQPCSQLDRTLPNYWPLDQEELNLFVTAVHARHPSSLLYVSPLQDYSPASLCPEMGNGGTEIPTYKRWLSQVVDGGLALAGPGVDKHTDLGPLAENGTVWTDHCHPTGDPNHPAPFQGSGVQLLGAQLSAFFDAR